MAQYTPTAYSFRSYGWKSGGNDYNAADVPIPVTTPTGVDRTVLESLLAYEWFDQSGRYALGRNPPFLAGPSGRLPPSLSEEQGRSNRVLRGFIRRAEYDRADYKSGARLYFMYNPETITRDYVSYLDQGALDPFNTVFQSGNLVPPPSFMDFTFSLFFDRQEEAQNPSHPGVFVDYEYFDLVVRNVDPSIDPTSPTSTTLPDNGVMMVNPRDITVVFSPQITVQGRPSNARVSFQKFTHRMVPTRMQIDLTMRVTYFGPMRDVIEYTKEEATVTDSVPFDPNVGSDFTMTRDDIEKGSAQFLEDMAGGLMYTQEQLKELALQVADEDPDSAAANGINIEANAGINAAIAEFAKTETERVGGTYLYSDRSGFPKHQDCSGLVWGAFRHYNPPYNDDMGGVWRQNSTAPSTQNMIAEAMNGTTPVREIFKSESTSKTTRVQTILPNLGLMVKGDLLFRKAGVIPGHVRDDGTPVGHVGFVYSNDVAGKRIEFLDATSEGKSIKVRNLTYDFISTDYTHCYRPMIGAPDQSGNREVPDPGSVW